MITELAGIHYRPLIAVLCPLLVALLVLSAKKLPNRRESYTIIGSSLLFLAVLSMTPHVLKEGPIRLSLFNLFPGVDFLLNVDAFGLIFATTTSSLWILVSFYSIGYMRSLKEHAQGRYFTCFALTIFGAVGVALLALERSSGTFTDVTDLAALTVPSIQVLGQFTCRACENRCAIDRLEVAGRRFPFGLP